MSSASISPHLHLNHSHHHNHSSTTLPSSFAFFLPFPSPPRLIVLRASATLHGGGVDSEDPSVLRRPVVSPSPLPSFYDEVEEKLGSTGDEDGGEETGKSGRARGRNRRMSDPEWVDWEDKILEDTVPLVGFVRMILHSGKYESGERLSAEHEKAIEERLLAHHPEREKKIGCGIDYITIGYHPDFEGSRCLFIVRKDGELVDFSYWKCIKSLIRKKYPLYADSFILRHFRRRRNSK